MELPGEKLLGRLWETLADKGIGSLLRPWQIRREGRARAEANRDELLLLAQAEHDSQEIRLGRRRLLSDGSTVARRDTGPVLPAPEVTLNRKSLDSRSIAESVNEATFADTLRKEVNVAKAVLHAESELAENPAEPSIAKVDEDWLFRWRDSASTVSAEYLQQLWGKVLAGEVKSPNTFSLRTLEFLRNISQEEAKEIELLATFVIDGVSVYRDIPILEAAGAQFGFFLRMQELGLIIGVDAFGLERTIPSAEPTRYWRPLLGGDFTLLVEHDDPKKILKLPIYKVTPIGNQVLALGTSQTNLSYLRSVGQALCKQGYRVQLARYVLVSDLQIRYFNPEKVCPESAPGAEMAKPAPT
jgi:hypothetical protein